MNESDNKKNLTSLHVTMYDSTGSYLRSTESYLRSTESYLRSTKKIISDVTNNVKNNIKNNIKKGVGIILPNDKLKIINTTDTTNTTNTSTTDINNSKTPLNLGIENTDQFFSVYGYDMDLDYDSTASNPCGSNLMILEDVKIEEIKMNESDRYLESNVTMVPNEQLDQLLQDVTDIKEISMDMASMLDVQNKNLQKIDDNTTSASIYIDEGSKELEKASKYRNDGVINVASVSSGAIVGSLFGPLGAAVGAFVGLISSTAINNLR
jgi:hypothetical protein